MISTRKYRGVTITKIEMMGSVRWEVDGVNYHYLADAKNAIDNGSKSRKWSES